MLDKVLSGRSRTGAFTPCSQAVKRLLALASSWPQSLSDAAPRTMTPCRTARQLRPDEVDELVRGWEAGRDVAQLAEQHGVHRSTVGKYLKARGIKTRELQLSPDQLRQAVELYAQGWTLVQVATEFGTTKKSIRKRLAELGVVIRRGGRGELTTEGATDW